MLLAAAFTSVAAAVFAGIGAYQQAVAAGLATAASLLLAGDRDAPRGRTWIAWALLAVVLAMFGHTIPAAIAAVARSSTPSSRP